MKKIARFFLIVAILAGVLFLAYFFFLRADGFTDREQLVTDYLTNLEVETNCNDYFNPETMSACDNFTTTLDGKTVEIISVEEVGSDVDATIEVDGIEIPFTFTFYEYEPSGLRGILNNEYYLIDTIR